jgi:mono/diheme cytochrome c family protein
MRFVWRRIVLTAAINLLAAGIAGRPAVFAQSAEEKNPFPSTPGVLAEGKELYLSAGCYACHGTQATGRGRLGPDLTDLKKKDAEIYELLMKTFKGKVTSEEMWKIMAYLRSLGER